jgi:thioredoxin reductase
VTLVHNSSPQDRPISPQRALWRSRPGVVILQDMQYDAAIVGGGPAGLSAALNLGRARKRVILFDGAPRRNAAAEHVYGFVTRDGVAPNDFRALARAELAPYGTVFHDEPLAAITGESGHFTLGSVTAKVVVLALGMVDVMLPIPGFAEAWGQRIFVCPFCHGYEVRETGFGVLATPALPPAMLAFYTRSLRAWTDDVTLFSGGADLGDDAADLARIGLPVETAPVQRIESHGDGLRVHLEGGRSVDRRVLFAHPGQRQTDLVTSLGLELDSTGYLAVSPMMATSRAGIFAAGDLITMRQNAVGAAAAGAMAGAMAAHELTAAALRP